MPFSNEAADRVVKFFRAVAGPRQGRVGRFTIQTHGLAT